MELKKLLRFDSLISATASLMPAETAVLAGSSSVSEQSLQKLHSILRDSSRCRSEPSFYIQGNADWDFPVNTLYYPELYSESLSVCSNQSTKHLSAIGGGLFTNTQNLSQVLGLPLAEDFTLEPQAIIDAIDTQVDASQPIVFTVKYGCRDSQQVLTMQLAFHGNHLYFSQLLVNDVVIYKYVEGAEDNQFFNLNSLDKLSTFANLVSSYNARDELDRSIDRWRNLTTAQVQPILIPSLNHAPPLTCVGHEIEAGSIAAVYILPDNTLIAGYVTNYRMANQVPPKRALLWLGFTDDVLQGKDIFIMKDRMCPQFIASELPEQDVEEADVYGVKILPYRLSRLERIFDSFTLRKSFLNSIEKKMYNGEKRWPFYLR